METQVINQRFKMGKVQPKAYEALDPLDNYVENASIPGVFKEFIRIRASQINGCAYCVNAHTRDARKLGVADEKIVLISVWHEARNIFSEEEQLILEMTEEITLIHRHGLSNNLYQRSLDAFGETGTAEIIMSIISINAWNRIGVGLKMEPQL